MDRGTRGRRRLLSSSGNGHAVMRSDNEEVGGNDEGAGGNPGTTLGNRGAGEVMGAGHGVTASNADVDLVSAQSTGAETTSRNTARGRAPSSGYTGISKREGRWAARLCVDSVKSKFLALGRYTEILDAAKAYAAAAHICRPSLSNSMMVELSVEERRCLEGLTAHGVERLVEAKRWAEWRNWREVLGSLPEPSIPTPAGVHTQAPPPFSHHHSGATLGNYHPPAAAFAGHAVATPNPGAWQPYTQSHPPPNLHFLSQQFAFNQIPIHQFSQVKAPIAVHPTPSVPITPNPAGHAASHNTAPHPHVLPTPPSVAPSMAHPDRIMASRSHHSDTSASHLVDKACSEYLAEPDWTTNLQLCDLLNVSPGKVGDAMRAVHKKVTSRHPQVQLSALTLLETVMKNCGGAVHAQVVEKGVLADVAKIAKKGGASPAATARARGLIQEWADVFPPGPTCRHTEYFLTFDELKVCIYSFGRSGVPFPPNRHTASSHHSPSIPMPAPPVPLFPRPLPPYSPVPLLPCSPAPCPPIPLPTLQRSGVPFPPQRHTASSHHSPSIPMPAPERAAASHGVPPGGPPLHLHPHANHSTPPQLYNSPTYGSPVGGYSPGNPAASYNGAAYNGAGYHGARSPLAGPRALPPQPQPPPLHYQQQQQQQPQAQQQQRGSGTQDGASDKPMSLTDITTGLNSVEVLSDLLSAAPKDNPGSVLGDELVQQLVGECRGLEGRLAATINSTRGRVGAAAGGGGGVPGVTGAPGSHDQFYQVREDRRCDF
ncbi:unnamed protein product [Closterium sp. Yama58-4]|nr:unnamed protein product [Closterium sp. Yama58-4]